MRTTIRGLKRLIKEEVNSRLGKKGEDIYLHPSDAMAHDIEKDLFDMVTTSYAKVGGNPKIQKPSDIGAEYEDWIVADIDDDPDPDIFVAGNPRNGKMKLGVTATDGTPEAKAHLMQLKKKLLNNGAWAEVSDAPAHIALNKLGIKPVEDEQKVRDLLGGKEIQWHGDHPEGKFPGTHGWYSRAIGGQMHAKIIVGDV